MFYVVTEETERVMVSGGENPGRGLGTRTTVVKTVADACQFVVTALGENHRCPVLSPVPDGSRWQDSPAPRREPVAGWVCDGSRMMDLTDPPGTATWPLALSTVEGGLVHVDLRKRFDGLPCGPWKASPSEAIVLPLWREPGTNLGIPRRRSELMPPHLTTRSRLLRACRPPGRAVVSNGWATRKKENGPRHWPSSTRPRRLSSPTSATISHALDPDARPRRGCTRRPPAPNTRRATRIGTPRRCVRLRKLVAQHAARFPSRIEAGRVQHWCRAEPTWQRSRPSLRACSAPPSRGRVCGCWCGTAHRWERPLQSTGTCGRRSF